MFQDHRNAPANIKKILVTAAWILAFLLLVVCLPKVAPAATDPGGPWIKVWLLQQPAGAANQPTAIKLWRYDITGKARQGTWEATLTLSDTTVCTVKSFRSGSKKVTGWLCYWPFLPTDKNYMYKAFEWNAAGYSPKPIPEPQVTCGGTPGSGCPCHLYASATGCTE